MSSYSLGQDVQDCQYQQDLFEVLSVFEDYPGKKKILFVNK